MLALRRPALPLLTLLALVPAASAAAQARGDGGLRVGVQLGGTSFVALAVEYQEGGRSLDLTVGTWSFRDLSVSLVARQYLGVSAMQPVVGGGLWTVLSWPGEGERSGASLVARFPIGFDWHAGGGHAIGFDLNVNRALWVRRAGEEDPTPPNDRLVPLPGVSYRWAW